MRKLFLCALLLLWTGITLAQTVSSRNNHTGLWTRRVSWMQEWPGINSSNPLPAADISLYGYIVHGTLTAPADMGLSGSGNELIVYDTLRVHGNLTVAQFSHLTIETEGVLIVHGHYNQNDWGRLTNKGKMIVLGDLKLLGSTNASNTGSLYVGGASSTGGWPLNPKDLPTLAAEDPVTSFFAHANVITSQCSGANSGTLNYTGYGSILRWEYSTDYFVSDIRTINSISTQHTYTNLTQTTTFRIYYNDKGVVGYSNGATIITESQSGGGEISGPVEVCGPVSSSTFALSGHYGTVVRWEWSSSSDFAAGTVQSQITNEESFTLSGITEFTYIRAVVKNGNCSESYSSTHLLKAYPATNGGSLSGPTAVCQTPNSGTIVLGSHRGNVLWWEVSTDNFASDIRTIADTAPEQTFSDLTATTWYRAVVKSGPCAMAYSTPHKVEVMDLQGGSVSGPAAVCAGTNAGTLTLEGNSGTVVRWEWSNDGFATHTESIPHTQTSYSFSNLTADSWFRAIVGGSGCAEIPSTAHKVAVDALSEGGALSGTASVCTGENSGTLRLEGYRGNILRWEYSSDNFAIDLVALAHTTDTYTFSNLSADRWYRAVVQNGSCSVETSASFRVSVTQLAGGTLSGPSVLCQDTGGQVVLSDYQGQIIRWESSTDNFAGSPQIHAETTSTLSFASLAATTWFRAVVGNAECGETLSDSWRVEVDMPSIAGTLSGTEAVCTPTNSGSLQLQDYSGAIVRWEASTDSFTGTTQAIAHTDDVYAFADLASTTWYRAVVQNGSCAPAYSQPFEVRVTPASQGGTLAGAATVCYGTNSGTLTLENRVGQVLRWESSTDNFATTSVIPNTGDTHSYQDLTSTTAYRAVVQNGSCSQAYSQVATITVEAPVAGGLVEADAVVIGGDNSGTLNLVGHSGPVLRWEVSTDNFASDIQAIANTTTTQTYEDIAITSWFRAVISAGNCGSVYAAAARIQVNRAPIAQNDTLVVAVAPYQASLSVLQNDTDPDGDLLRAQPIQLLTAAGGTASLDANGILSYEPPANYLGTDSLRYTVCDQVAGASLCHEALIVLDVRLPAAQLVVYQGVSPNGDGKNDFWFIEHIERYPDNYVQLYDRYGTLVYEAWGYDNQNSCFSGQANRGVRPGGNQLPDGTYFYKIITAAAAPVLKGYIVLKN